MEPRIERRRMQCCRWLMVVLIALAFGALARLASAACPAPQSTAYGLVWPPAAMKS